MYKIGILFMVESLGYGGAEKQLITLIKSLNKSMFNVYLITWQENSLESLLTDEDCQWFRLKRKNKFDFKLVQIARDLLRENKVNIVHGFLNNGNLYGLLAVKLARKGFFIASERSAKRNLPFFQNFYKPITHRLADITISNSEAGLQFVREFKVDDSKLKLIRNALDVNRFNSINKFEKQLLREKLGIQSSKLVGICVGRLVELKNQLGLLEAFNQVKNCDMIIYCIGNGDNQYKQKLEEYVKYLDINNKFIILEAQENIENYYQAADILILNSDFEGNPNVVMEAMSCELPIISTNVGDVINYVDQSCGWLIEPRNNLQLIEALNKFIATTESQRIEMGKASRRKLLSLGVAPLDMAKAHEEVYLKLIS